MSIVYPVFKVSDQIDDGRTLLRILAHTMSEVGELAEEIEIAEGLSNKSSGKDGVTGEAIDAIICLLDIIRRYNPGITEDELGFIVAHKLSKWKSYAVRN